MNAEKKTKPRRLTLARGIRFECKQCADCCRNFPVSLTAAEVERYEARDWSEVFGKQTDVVTSVRSGRALTHYIRRKPDGTCLFLGEDDLCDMHRKYGGEDKPLVCRMFPFAFVEGDAERDRPVATAYFACSSVAAGDGQPLAQQRKALDTLIAEVQAVQPVMAPIEPIRFEGGRAYSRLESEFLLDLLVKELEDARRPFPERILAAGKFLSLVASSRFNSLGGTTKKIVSSFSQGINDQVKRNLLSPRMGPAPFPQRLLFRMIMGFAARQDPAYLVTAGFFRRAVRRFGNFLAGLSFMAGTGAVRPLGRDQSVIVGQVRRMAPAADPSSPEADGALTRYFVGHLSGRVLFNPTFQVRELLPALGLLFRQYPLILLFARAACFARGGEKLTREDYASALRTADWNLGRVPWTSGPMGWLRRRLLSDVEVSFAHLDWCATPPDQVAAQRAAALGAQSPPAVQTGERKP